MEVGLEDTKCFLYTFYRKLFSTKLKLALYPGSGFLRKDGLTVPA